MTGWMTAGVERDYIPLRGIRRSQVLVKTRSSPSYASMDALNRNSLAVALKVVRGEAECAAGDPGAFVSGSITNA